MALSPVSELVGRVLAGRYRLTAPVGAGASAQVFVADDVHLRRRVAVKVLHPALAHDPTFLRRFQAEAQAAAALNHPNILAVYDWGEDAVPFQVTEYLEGGSLRAMLDEHGTLSLSQTLVVGLEAARGLHYAHSRGFVHRDIKPANLLFGDDRRLRIADFGLARALAEAAWTEPEGVVLGTARYASPEQATGGSLDGKSDVYSLALVLVECVTGCVPHRAETALASLQARVGRSIEPPDELGPLAPVIEGAGRADPAARWPAAEVGRALMAAAEQLPSPQPLPLVAPHVAILPALDAPAVAGTARAPGGAGPARAAAAHLVDDPHAIRLHTDVAGPSSADPSATTLARPGTRVPPAPPPPPPPPSTTVGGPGAPPDRHDARRAGRVSEPATHRAPRGRRRWSRRAAAAVSMPAVATTADATTADRPKRRRRASRWVAGVLFVAALATLGLITLSLVRGAGRPKLVVVPKLVGVSAAEVAGLIPPKADWHVQYLPDQRRDGSRPGEILEQDPPEGGKLAQGGVLKLTRSAGEELRTVPDLAGLPQDQAAAQLQALGLQVAPQPAYDEQVPPGAVIRVDQRGQQVEKGSTVAVVVSQGPAPRQVPDLAKQTPEQARAALEAKGLVAADGQDYSETVEKGKVIGTRPAAGENVPKGSSVTVVVSLGRQPIEVANVIGMQAADAADTLEAQGLVVRTNGAPNRAVIATDPMPGATLYRGDTVIIVTRQT